MLNASLLAVLEAAMADWDVPAAAIGVSLGGAEETAALGCGPATRFRIASVTKPFTALAALQLLDLEGGTDGIWAPDVRVRHLLSHTSGYDCEVDDMSSVERVIERLPSVRRWVGVEEVWSYSNAGYWLTGVLCTRAAGVSFEDAVAARVVEPLGLEATSFGPADVAGTGPAAEGVDVYPPARRPSGGLTSNVADVLRFGRALLREPRLRVVQGKPVGGVYGLGLQGERVGGVDVWGHGGSWGGYQSSLLTVPERDAVFVGLTNASYGSKALRRVEDLFFEEVVGAPRAVRPTVTLPRPALESFAGTYANSDGRYEVEALATRLRVAFEDGVFEARPIAERTFEIVDGVRVKERLDFPRAEFGRFGSRLAERIA